MRRKQDKGSRRQQPSQGNRHTQVLRLDRQIDALVYELYDLTDEEIALV